MRSKAMSWDFPGSPVRTLCFQCKGCRFDPLLGNGPHRLSGIAKIFLKIQKQFKKLCLYLLRLSVETVRTSDVWGQWLQVT